MPNQIEGSVDSCSPLCATTITMMRDEEAQLIGREEIVYASRIPRPLAAWEAWEADVIVSCRASQKGPKTECFGHRYSNDLRLIGKGPEWAGVLRARMA